MWKMKFNLYYIIDTSVNVENEILFLKDYSKHAYSLIITSCSEALEYILPKCISGFNAFHGCFYLHQKEAFLDLIQF